jgi:DNA-binding beta-propeller fold protein YncE
MGLRHASTSDEGSHAPTWRSATNRRRAKKRMSTIHQRNNGGIIMTKLNRSSAVFAIGAPAFVAAMLAVGSWAVAAGSGKTVILVRDRAGGTARLVSISAGSCSTTFSSGPSLSPGTALLSLAGPPFGVAVTPSGSWAFAVESGNGRLAVLSTTSFRPRVLRTIRIPTGAQGASITSDGKYLLITNGVDGATVVRVSRAEAGAAHAVLGTLAQPDTGAGGAIEVATSPDSRYAFVSVEYEARIAVYNLGAALADHFSRSSYIGSIPVGTLVGGLTVSPDGHWLYAASEGGSLSVIRLSTAERNPSHSVVSTATVGCNPTRIVSSPDGTTVWVAARNSNQLLAFSASRLRTNPVHSLLAAVQVGETPIGLALIRGGREIIVADSNRFDRPGARAGLTVVRTAAALAHHPALVGTIHTGLFPRELAVEANHPTLLVGNYGSNQLEAVDIHALP